VRFGLLAGSGANLYSISVLASCETFAFLDITSQAHRYMNSRGVAIRLKKRGKAANDGNAAALSSPKAKGPGPS